MKIARMKEMLDDAQHTSMDGREALIAFIRMQLPAEHGGTMEDHRRSPRSTDDDMATALEPSSMAPPLRAVLDVPGWLQQTEASPWCPVSPYTIATVNKYKEVETTFSWIVQNDVWYVKWILDHTDNLSDENMLLMNKYFREHYQRALPPGPRSNPPTLPYIPTLHEAGMSTPSVMPPVQLLTAQMQVIESQMLILVEQMQELLLLVRPSRPETSGAERSTGLAK